MLSKLKTSFKWIVLGLSILFSCTLNAQEEEVLSSFDKNKKYRDYFNIYVSNNNFFPASIKGYGLSKVESTFSKSIGFGVGYTRRINKNWGVSVGMEYTPSKVSFRIIEVDDNIMPNQELTGYSRTNLAPSVDILLNLNLSVLKDFYIKDPLYFRFQVGASLDYMNLVTSNVTITYSGESLEDYKLFFNMFLKPQKGQQRITGSYFIKTGFGVDLKEKRHLNINVVAKHSPTLVAFGLYSFHNTQDISRGSINRRLSYLGLELNYSIGLGK